MKGIEIKEISKSFGKNIALDQVSTKFEEHKIYGLLGRNGAGKSTLLKIIAEQLYADAGEALLDDQKILSTDEAFGKIYLMSEQTLYPEKMKVKDVIRWTKEFYPSADLDYARELLNKFELSGKKKVKALSTGYLSILKIIIALSVNVSYVLLDEPILGLDANHRELFYRELLERYMNSNTTFVIATHLIEEVSEIVEDVVIIHDGKVLISKNREELLSKAYMVSGPETVVEKFCEGKEVIGVEKLGGLRTAYVNKIENIQEVEGLEIRKMSLQSMFIQLTNKRGANL